MGIALPSELLMSLEDSCPCRSIQLRQLTSLYSDIYPPPPNLVVHGLQGTGKLHTVLSVLAVRHLAHAVIKSRECLSLRHLLSKILAACVDTIYQGEDEGAESDYESRCESVNAVGVHLQRLLQGRDEKLVIVLDGIDKQRGLNPHTLPALARLSDFVPNLCLILIVTTPRALVLQKAGVPYLHFPPYTRAEAIFLVVRSPPPLAPQQYLDSHQDVVTLQKWYSLFATTVYDSIFSQTSLSFSHFQRVCQTLWPRFIWPYINGDQPPGKGKNAEWDFTKLLVRQRPLFQAAGEETLAARLVPKDHATTFQRLQREQLEARQPPIHSLQTSKIPASGPSIPQPSPPPSLIHSNPLKSPLLPLFSTILLTAAYLASHTPPKLDILLFSRLSSSSRSARVKKSYHRRKLFQSPSKQKGTTTAQSGREAGAVGGSGTSTPKKHRITTTTTTTTTTTPRAKSGLDLNLHLPRPFPLERLVAILRAIHPHGLPQARSVVDKVCTHLAELQRLRLVVPADGAGGGGSGGTRAMDDSGEERRWRVNVPKAFVEDLGDRFVREGVGGLVREFELVEG